MAAILPEASTPPKARRQSSGRRLSGFHPGQHDIDENDDDAERNKAAEEKQRQAQAQAQKARSPLRGTPGHARRQQRYQECLQMADNNVRERALGIATHARRPCLALRVPLTAAPSSLSSPLDHEALLSRARAHLDVSQKVTKENAFNLDLIDHMNHMIHESTGTEGDNTFQFQKASRYLDAGVKIYEYRVDSVFTNAYKLVGSYNRGADVEADPSESEPVEGDQPGGAPVARRPKRAAAGDAGCKHLEANPASLNLKKVETGFDVDPLFHQTSAKFDENTAKGLLLNNLPVQDGCRVVFDSSDVVGEDSRTSETAPQPARLPLSTLSGLIPRDRGSLELAMEFVELWSVHNPRPELDRNDGRLEDQDGGSDTGGDINFDHEEPSSDHEEPSSDHEESSSDLVDFGMVDQTMDPIEDPEAARMERKLEKIISNGGEDMFQSVGEIIVVRRAWELSFRCTHHRSTKRAARPSPY